MFGKCYKKASALGFGSKRREEKGRKEVKEEF
jgi:hypothetical protein